MRYLAVLLALAGTIFGASPVVADDFEIWFKGDKTIIADVLFDDLIDCLNPKLARKGDRFTVSTRCTSYQDPTPHSAELIVRLQVDDGDFNDVTRDRCSDQIPRNQQRGNFEMKCTVVVPRGAR